MAPQRFSSVPPNEDVDTFVAGLTRYVGSGIRRQALAKRQWDGLSALLNSVLFERRDFAETEFTEKIAACLLNIKTFKGIEHRMKGLQFPQTVQAEASSSAVHPPPAPRHPQPTAAATQSSDREEERESGPPSGSTTLHTIPEAAPIANPAVNDDEADEMRLVDDVPAAPHHNIIAVRTQTTP